MRALFWLLYRLAAALALGVAGPFLLLRRRRHYLPTFASRLGRYPEPAPEPRGRLWIHAVSVGEALVADTLARALPSELPLLVTTITPTGQERARAAFGAPRAVPTPVTYLPFELAGVVHRFFDRFQPRALVLVEGDYWPLVLREAARRGVPVVVVNGRMSDRSFRRMARLRPLLGPLFGEVARFGMQTAEDRDKLLQLGIAAERITVTGNLKYESPEPARKPELEAALRTLAAGRPILVAGSTMPGEESLVLDAFSHLGRTGRALLVLAPRHPERCDEVERLLAEQGFSSTRRSRLAGEPVQVVLLDSLGELAGLYALAAAAFVGGTLVPKGGHNPLEPARFGVPLAVGPSMENFRDMAEQFDRERAWQRVATATELAAAWGRWLDDPEAARDQGRRATALIERNRGALDRTLALLEPVRHFLPGSAPPLP